MDIPIELVGDHAPTRLRPARDEDVGSLIAMHQRVFGKVMSREKRRWKLESCRGPGIAGVWVVESAGRVVFQYAGIPTRVRHQGRDVWAMVSVDTMADPDHRRRGLLTRVGAETYEQWKRGGVAMVIGCPNEQWGSRAAALGWTQVSELRWWIRHLDPVRLVRAKLRLPLSQRRAEDPSPGRADARVGALEDPQEYERLWDRMPEEGVVRDADWFRWRYLDAAAGWRAVGRREAGALLGCATFRVDDAAHASGVFGEVVAADFATQRALLHVACLRLREGGAARAALLVQRGSMLEESALASGFLPRAAAFRVMAVDLGAGLPRAALFQGADFDVV